MEKKYEIVSLGQNCMPRTVLTRGKIKPSKAQGELSCPFDLVKHRFDRILYYIENNFDGYFDDIHFELKKRCFFDFRGKGIWVKNDGTKFFHDKDCKKTDLKKLTERISRRINNFNNIMDSEKPILFVVNVSSRDNDIDSLYNILKKRRMGKPFKIAVFDIKNIVGDSDNKDIYILRLPAPIDNYGKNWNKRSFTNSKVGKYFEFCICEFVKHVLDTF